VFWRGWTRRINLRLLLRVILATGLAGVGSLHLKILSYQPSNFTHAFRAFREPFTGQTLAAGRTIVITTRSPDSPPSVPSLAELAAKVARLVNSPPNLSQGEDSSVSESHDVESDDTDDVEKAVEPPDVDEESDEVHPPDDSEEHSEEHVGSAALEPDSFAPHVPFPLKAKSLAAPKTRPAPKKRPCPLKAKSLATPKKRPCPPQQPPPPELLGSREDVAESSQYSKVHPVALAALECTNTVNGGRVRGSFFLSFGLPGARASASASSGCFFLCLCRCVRWCYLCLRPPGGGGECRSVASTVSAFDSGSPGGWGGDLGAVVAADPARCLRISV
jgi:hypothetical protein